MILHALHAVFVHQTNISCSNGVPSAQHVQSYGRAGRVICKLYLPSILYSLVDFVQNNCFSLFRLRVQSLSSTNYPEMYFLFFKFICVVVFRGKNNSRYLEKRAASCFMFRINCLFLSDIKGTVDVISSDPPFAECHIRFTTIS